MTSDSADDPFKKATEDVEAAYQQAISELKSKVNRAKSEALKKVTS